MDDEQSARSAITRILEREGHEVLDFEDAAPALEEVDYATVDLAVVDLQMPTSGYDAIEELRARRSQGPHHHRRQRPRRPRVDTRGTRRPGHRPQALLRHPVRRNRHRSPLFLTLA